ncbi:MAG: PEP-CTERM sorting domain-containing protein [Desulfobacteraceae bacterium]|nr:MAG: PEP-CTERM sorting domain-containing protein [Desulfobacteraceae bacterium]
MKNLKVILILAVSLIICISDAFADNITIYDDRVSGSVGTWANRGTDPGEDQEVEPGMQTGQVWDLEGFFLDGNLLSMVGGYNFEAGYGGYFSGDIFIDDDGDAKYGVSGVSLLNGYDYAIKLDFGEEAYYVFEISSSGTLSDVLSYNSYGSSPWRYTPSEGETSIADGYFGLGDAYYDSQGAHYSITGIDLSFLDAGTIFVSHFTMGCGNDNLMGSGTTQVPEPTTLLLLGFGLVGLAGAGRKFKK